MKTNFVIVLLIATLGMSSCSKELMTPLNSSEIAVVESYIHTGDSVITVKVSKLLPFSDDTLEATEYITGLSVVVNGSLLTETEPGIYQLLLSPLRVQAGETYTVKFRYFDDTVSSVTSLPELPANFTASATVLYTDRITTTSGFPSGHMTDVELTWDNPGNAYFYVTVDYLDSIPDYINAAFEDLDLPITQSEPPTQTSGMKIGNRNLQFFGSYRVVLYRVNSEFADLYKMVNSNSNNITNPVTSITNGYGVFTGMSSDTLYLQMKEN